MQHEERRLDFREGLRYNSHCLGLTLKCRCHPYKCSPRSRLACLEARSLPSSDSMTPRKGWAGTQQGWFIIMCLVYGDGSFLRLLHKHRSAEAPWGKEASRGPLSSACPLVVVAEGKKRETGYRKGTLCSGLIVGPLWGKPGHSLLHASDPQFSPPQGRNKQDARETGPQRREDRHHL